MVKTTAGMLIALLLAGCATHAIEEAVLPPRIDYVCPGNLQLPVLRAEHGAAAAIMLNGKQVVMQRVPSGAQEKYSGEGYSLYLDGPRAMLEIDNRIIGPCESTIPLQMAPRSSF